MARMVFLGLVSVKKVPKGNRLPPMQPAGAYEAFNVVDKAHAFFDWAARGDEGFSDAESVVKMRKTIEHEFTVLVLPTTDGSAIYRPRQASV